MPTEQQIQQALNAGYTQQQIKLAMARAGVNKPKEKSLGGFAGNVVKSSGKLVGDLANTVLHPIDTAKSIVGLGSGIIQLAIPGEQGNEKLARAVGQFYLDRYGSMDKIKNTIYSDPAGFAMDVSTVLGLGAGGAKLVGLGKTAKILGRAAEIADPLNVASKIKLVPSKFKPNIAGKVGEKIADFGDTYAIKSTRIPTSKQTKLAQKMKTMNTRFGSTPESLIETTGLYGQDINAIDSYLKPLEEARTKAIRGSGLTVQNADVLKNFSDEIANLSTPEALLDPSSRLLREKLIAEARNYAQQNPVRRQSKLLESLDKTRARIDKSTPNAQFESDKAAIQRSLGNVYRGTVNNAAGTGELGKELSILYDFKDAVSKAPKGKNTLPMGITQSIATGTGLLSGGNPLSRVANAAIGYGATSLVNSPKFIGNVSKVAKNVSNYKTPQSMSKFLNYGNKAVNAGYNTAKVGRMTTNLGSNQGTPELLPTQSQQIKPVSYTKSIPQPVNTPVSTKKITYKAPENVFNNKSSFGKVKKLKAGSFN
jgi:hypothetical protein